MKMKNGLAWLGQGAASLLVVAAGCALALEPEAGPALYRMSRIWIHAGLAVTAGSFAYVAVRRAFRQMGVN